MTPTHRGLAEAYLALGDDTDAPPPQRSVPRVVSALCATVALALAGPLAWAAAGPERVPVDQPAATAAKLLGVLGADDDDGDDS